MERYQHILSESVILAVLSLLGTLAFLAFSIISKKRKITVGIGILVYFISLFVTTLFTVAIKPTSWGEWKNAGQLIFSYMGLYFLEWVDKRYLKIFDVATKKVSGLDLNDNESILEELQENEQKEL